MKFSNLIVADLRALVLSILKGHPFKFLIIKNEAFLFEFSTQLETIDEQFKTFWQSVNLSLISILLNFPKIT